MSIKIIKCCDTILKMLKRKTPSRTELELHTQEQILAQHGEEHLLFVLIKSQTPHDSARHTRRLNQTQKAERKKRRNLDVELR